MHPNKIFSAIVIALSLGLTGCQSTGNSEQLATENKNLKAKLETANTEIRNLKADKVLLEKDIDDLNYVISVLDTEKTSRIQESSLLRSQVRKFVQNRIDDMKSFLVEGNLLDYIGGELVERSVLEGSNITVVDLGNTIPKQGVLTGVGVFAMMPTTLKVKVLRRMEDELVNIWESNDIVIANSGETTVQFINSVSVEKDDVIAYEFKGDVGVGFETGTGAFQYTNEQLALGETVRSSSLLSQKEKRSYSLGVYGLLE